MVQSNDDIEQMNIVIIGHVDHGKSTVIGRLLADTGSLPEGKLDRVREMCRRSAKPFEFAFLLDALADEQSQGITIDAARCFFKTEKRRYIIIDAPGHIEFLKNMITGASHAQAALLVIDAHEGVKENTRRHGYMAALLGIRQVVVLVNKMDLVGYDQEMFTDLSREFGEFSARIGMKPKAFIPISAFHGDNIVNGSKQMGWYDGPTVVQMIDELVNAEDPGKKPFRMPLQDVYKFTEDNDERRIFAGTIVSGTIEKGDEVRFLPSGKMSRVKSIEGWKNGAASSAGAGQAAGFQLDTQVYIKPGEIMHRLCEPAPIVSTSFGANIFWVGRSPMVHEKKYKLKIGSARAGVYLRSIGNVLDTSDLSATAQRRSIERHEVAECVLETLKPIAFDLAADNEECGRFVIIDGFEIAGGGIITEKVSVSESVVERHVKERNRFWSRGHITLDDRIRKNGHKPKFVVVSGSHADSIESIAKSLEKELFAGGINAYYMGLSNMTRGIDSDMEEESGSDEEYVRRLGELAHLFTDAGILMIASFPNIEPADVEVLEALNKPNEIFFTWYGDRSPGFREKGSIIPECVDPKDAVNRIRSELTSMEILPEYII